MHAHTITPTANEMAENLSLSLGKIQHVYELLASQPHIINGRDYPAFLVVSDMLESLGHELQALIVAIPANVEAQP